MTDKKYIARTVPLTPDKLAVVEAYRDLIQQQLGFKLSLSDAIAHAVKVAMDEARGQLELNGLGR